jgi:hypothetical protein
MSSCKAKAFALRRRFDGFKLSVIELSRPALGRRNMVKNQRSVLMCCGGFARLSQPDTRFHINRKRYDEKFDFWMRDSGLPLSATVNSFRRRGLINGMSEGVQRTERTATSL